jgi:8-oxo-dGTP pyrophosphatase MutT (NUDIX family)
VPKDSWSLLGSRYLSDHRIFQIRHDLYRFEPAGVEREFVVIESPDWVNVVPLTEDGQVVLIRQYRHGIRAVSLEIPGGIIDPNESPLAAAVRELSEETGYVAERVRMLGRVRPNPAVQNNYQYMFLAEGCRRRSAPHPDPFEQIEVVVRPADEIPELVRREEICHSLAINALAYAGLIEALS